MSDNGEVDSIGDQRSFRRGRRATRNGARTPAKGQKVNGTTGSDRQLARYTSDDGCVYYPSGESSARSSSPGKRSVVVRAMRRRFAVRSFCRESATTSTRSFGPPIYLFDFITLPYPPTFPTMARGGNERTKSTSAEVGGELGANQKKEEKIAL